MRIVFWLVIFVLMMSSMLCRAQDGPREAAYDFNKKLGRGINFMASKINQNHHDPFDFNLIRNNSKLTRNKQYLFI